mmetsp:Transcript_30299/g.76232  ORF Transcript_30299/g.76232 Transcript_30299/m.76232 type:complete len:91 (-) Transcript_30299:134-406(-)
MRDTQAHLGKSPWEVPIGHVAVTGLRVLDSLYSGYGDLDMFGGRAPDYASLRAQGETWWQKEYPKLDYINGCWRTVPLETQAPDTLTVTV